MPGISIIGTGNMGSAIARIAAEGGADVQLITNDAGKASRLGSELNATVATVGDALTGEIVVLAVPYSALDELIAEYGDQFAGKAVVDITNPLDAATFDSLLVPADSSSAAQLAERVPDAKVLKAFNTTFAATLASGRVGDAAPTTVLVAGDDDDAKHALIAVVTAGGVEALDAGSLKRARELEAVGFLQLTLAAGEKVPWTAGFAVVR